MRVKIQARFINEKTLLIHFIEGKPNIRGKERFKKFVEKLETALKKDLRGTKIILSPIPLKHLEQELIEINWSRFDEYEHVFRLKDYL